MAEPVTPGVSSPGSGDGTSTPPPAQANYVKEDDFEGLKKFYNKEFQGLRKGQEATQAELKAIRDSFSSEPPATATSDGKGTKNLATAEGERRLKALEEALSEAKRERADALISTAISEATSGAPPGMQEVLHGYLRGRARIDGDAVVIEMEDGPQRLTAENIRKLKGSDAWFPASGRPGSGLREVGGGAATPGVDVDRGMRDQEYWEKNQPAILAELDRVRKAAG
jgi:uncharacterized protein YbjQ (UPF0145 family)